MLFIMIAVPEFQKVGFSFNLFWEMFCKAVPIWLVFLFPFFVLSLFNRFLFGKTLAVLGIDGIALENDFVRYDDISEIIFRPRLLSRNGGGFTYLTLNLKSGEKIDIMHFPHYALRKLKKHNPNIKAKTDKYGIFIILFTALFPSVLGVIFTFLQ